MASNNYDGEKVVAPLMAWASAKDLRERVASVPENWLLRFAAANPNDIRKFGDAQNSRLVYRVSAVMAAIERGDYFRCDARHDGLAPQENAGHDAAGGNAPAPQEKVEAEA